MSQTKAQLLNPLGDLDLTGQLTGVGATFTGNIKAVDGTFSGNVSIAGTLTKQDVTNVDSIGIITARDGVNVTSGSVSVTDGYAYRFGDGSYRIEGKDDGANARIGFVAGGSERVRIDGTGRVGIGTDSASALLHIEGTQTNLWLERNTQTLKIDANYGNGGDQSLTASAALRFYTGGANERLRITSGGNVSINNTNIQKRFSVKETSTSVPAGGGVYYNAAIGGSAGTAGYSVGIAFDPEGSDARYKNAIVSEATGDGYSRGKLHFLLDSANDSGEATLNESRVTILDSGNVGINTVTPANLLDIHGANGAGGLRLTETNHTNLNRHGRIFEYAGGLYFHSRNDTANGDFIFRGGLDGVEKLRIGSSSQIGIAGANYGTSGQVLTSGGASAAPSWADAAGGMSEYDVWSVTSNSAETTWNDAVIGSGSPSAINIARQTTTQNPRFVKIGTGMSYASGIWTFPSTGYWEVVFRPIVYVNGGSTLIQTFKIELTENNGTSWNEITRAHSGGGNNFEQPQTSVFNMVYITDVSNQKLRFIWDSEGSGHLQGAGGQLESNWVWKKVA